MRSPTAGSRWQPVTTTSRPSRQADLAGLCFQGHTVIVTAAVEGALRSVEDGSGRLLLVVGEAGAGKTRLAQQAFAAAAGAGLATNWLVAGRPGAPAFWPWSQLLTALPDDVRARHPLAMRLAERSDEPLARFTLFEDVAALLADAGRARPLLFVLDDLHEADGSSLSLLAHVAPFLRGIPVLIVATVRTRAVPARAEWSAVWPELLRCGESVRVGPMSSEQIEAVVADTLGRQPALGVVERIAQRTGGNALFVCELARLLPSTREEVEQLPSTVGALIGVAGDTTHRKGMLMPRTSKSEPPIAVAADVIEGRYVELGPYQLRETMATVEAAMAAGV